MPRRIPLVAGMAGLAALYVLLARIGLELSPVSRLATLVWAPSGLALAAVLLLGWRFWPGIVVGAFTANLLAGAPPLAALAIAGGNTAEALLGAAALTRLPGFRRDLTRLRDVLALVGLSALAATTVAATAGTLTLAVAGMLEPGAAWMTWRAWWIGDALGVLVVAPALLTWAGRPPRPAAVTALEAGVLGVALVGLSTLLFWSALPSAFAAFSQPIALLPVLLWAALRFGQRGAATATLVTAIIAIAGTVDGRGPFAQSDVFDGLELLQGFLGEVAAMLLILGAVVTEREHVGTERAQLLRRAEEAVRVRDETLAVVSHDLRNPLNAVSLTANSMARHATEPAVRRQAELIERAVARMTRLIQDLLDTAAITVSRLAIVRALYDPRDLVLEAVETWRPAAAERRVQLVAACPPQGWRARYDRERMLQVVSNLLSNAIKVTPAGESTLVTTWVENDETRIAVQDRGAGIDPADVPRIFERYWRGSAHAGEGAGLGLYIARGIVEAHGGRLWYEPADGGGSVLVVALPGVYPPKRPRDE